MWTRCPSYWTVRGCPPRQHGGEGSARSDEGGVDRQMMPTELKHPGRSRRRLAHKRGIVESTAEVGRRAGPADQCVVRRHLQACVAEPFRAQDLRQQRVERRILAGVQVLAHDAAALDEAGGEVGPARPLFVVFETVDYSTSLRIGQRRQEGLSRRHDRLRLCIDRTDIGLLGNGQVYALAFRSSTHDRAGGAGRQPDDANDRCPRLHSEILPRSTIHGLNVTGHNEVRPGPVRATACG